VQATFAAHNVEPSNGFETGWVVFLHDRRLTVCVQTRVAFAATLARSLRVGDVAY